MNVTPPNRPDHASPPPKTEEVERPRREAQERRETESRRAENADAPRKSRTPPEVGRRVDIRT